MKDHEYILNEINNHLTETLKTIENRMLTGSLSNMEDYKFHLGIRHAIVKLNEYIKLISREDVIND
jgi:hypothetical protein